MRPAAPHHPLLALAILCAGQFLMVSGATFTMVALPTLRLVFDVPSSWLHLVVTAYAVPFGCLLLFGGAVADRFGHRRIFLLGLAGFTLSSAACAVADDFGPLVLGRALQGLSAALVTPAALGLLNRLNEDPRQRMRAMGAWSMVGAIGAVMGNVLGGLLTELIHWRAVFLFNLPLAALLVLLAGRFLPLSPPRREQRLDLPGTALATSALLSLFLAISLAPGLGRSPLPPLLALLGAFALGGLFLHQQWRSPQPLLPLRDLRSRAALAFAIVVMTGLTYAPFLAMTVYFQDILLLSPLRAGLAITPWAIMVALTSRLLPRLGARIPIRRIIALGFLAIAGGMAGTIAAFNPAIPLIYGLVPAQLLLGIGNAMTFFGAGVMAMSALSRDQQGVAAGLLTSAQQIGNALTITLFSVLSVLMAEGGGAPLGGLLADTVFRGEKEALIFCILAAIVTALATRLLPGQLRSVLARPPLPKE